MKPKKKKIAYKTYFSYILCFSEEWDLHYRTRHRGTREGYTIPPSSESEGENVEDNDDSEPDVILLPDDDSDPDEVRVIGQAISPSSIPSPEIIEILAVDQTPPQRTPLGPARTPSRKRQGPQNPSDTPQKRPKVCFKKKDNSRPIILEDPAIVGKSYF